MAFRRRRAWWRWGEMMAPVKMIIGLAVVCQFALLAPLKVLGQCAAGNGIPTPTGMSAIFVSGDLGTARTTAVNKWESGCAGSGTQYPNLQIGSGSGVTFNVISHQGARTGSAPGDGCELTQVFTVGGQLSTADIHIWTGRRDGSPCNATPSDLIAHGMGHALGLLDSIGSCNSDKSSCSCDGTIMGRPIPGQTSSMVPEACEEIRQNWDTAVEVESPVPGPNPCFVGAVPQTWSLPLEGGAPKQLAADLELPSRVENVAGITYLMEEWAVIRHRFGGPFKPAKVRVHRSSPGFGSAEGLLLASRLAARGDGMILVIHSAVHPSNARSIPMPELRLPSMPVSYVGQPANVALRLDFGEDRKLRDIQLLDSTAALPTGLDLPRKVQESLELRFRSDRQHRVVLFVVISLRDGAATLVNHQFVLPLCCCNPVCI